MWITLIAMTVSSAMILVDQTSVPLAIPHAMDDLGRQRAERNDRVETVAEFRREQPVDRFLVLARFLRRG